MVLSIRVISAILLSLPPGLALAGAGDLDPTFASAGVLRNGGESLATDPNGNLYVLGRESCSGSFNSCAVIRRFSPDADIPPVNVAKVEVLNTLPYLRRFPSGRFVFMTLEGYATRNESWSLRAVLANGNPDASFTPPVLGNDDRNGAAQELLTAYSDDRFIFASPYLLARYQPNGTIDPAFNGGVPLRRLKDTLAWSSVAPLADGGMLILGTNATVPPVGEVRLQRRRPDGSLDTTFGSSGEVIISAVPGGMAIAGDVILQPDGKILVTYHAASVALTTYSLHVRRLLSSGAVDNTFGAQGTVRLSATLPNPTSGPPFFTATPLLLLKAKAHLALQPGGHVLVTSTDGNGMPRVFIARLETDGRLDTSFGTGGNSLLDISAGADGGDAAVLQPSGAIVIAGRVDFDIPALMRIQPRTQGAVRVQPDRLLAGGVNQPYSYRLSSAGGATPLTYSVAAGALPAGITLAGDTLRGTATTPGRSRFFIRATDNLGVVDTRNYALDILDTPALVTDYYVNIFYRLPERSGLTFWTAEADRMVSIGASRVDVLHAMAMTFFNSIEYLGFSGTPRARTNEEFVDDLYRTFLSRDPDPGGLEYWVSQITSGKPRSAVLSDFLFTLEFEQLMERLFGPPTSRAETQIVVDFYRGLLARLPDSDGFRYWLGRLRAAQCGGNVSAEARAISQAFVGSQEYANRQNALNSADRNREFVSDLYNAFMRRGADLAGFNAWVNQLDSGAMTRGQVLEQFIQSPEFQARVRDVTDQGCAA